MIAAFDIAIRTGVCFGDAGTKPTLTTFDLGAGVARPLQLATLHSKCIRLFRLYEIKSVRIESPLNIRAAINIGADESALLLLRGGIGVVEAAASAAGIDDIGFFGVQDARQHLTGQRTFPRIKIPGTKRTKSTAKEAVMKMCKMLGINAVDYDQSDAAAGWLLCCARANPRLAHLGTPLFPR